MSVKLVGRSMEIVLSEEQGLKKSFSYKQNNVKGLVYM